MSTSEQPNRHNEGPWCDDCHGYTHMPYCPHYQQAAESRTDPLLTHEEADLAVRAIPLQALPNNEGNTTEIDKWSVAVGVASVYILDKNGKYIANLINERIAQKIIQDHADHQQCAAQLRFLGDCLEAHAKEMANLAGDNERLRALLRVAVSPTHCYCAVMDGKKCWQCEVREALNHAAGGEGKNQ